MRRMEACRDMKVTYRREEELSKRGAHLCAHGEELEDGEHASRGGVVAVQETQCVAYGVPHALDGSPRPALRDEPIREGDIVQVADILQRTMLSG